MNKFRVRVSVGTVLFGTKLVTCRSCTNNLRSQTRPERSGDRRAFLMELSPSLSSVGMGSLTEVYTHEDE